MKKEANVVMLATEDKTSLFINKVNNKLLYDLDKTIKEVLPSGDYQHLYIISDDEIKEGDWVYHYEYGIGTVINYARKGIDKVCDWYVKFDNIDNSLIVYNCHLHKIIATTDKSLNLLLIDDDFVKEFCDSNVTITDVLVEYANISCECVDGYCICDKDYFAPNNFIIIHPIEEKVYTKEQVIDLLQKQLYDFRIDCLPFGEYADFVLIEFQKDWIKQNI